MPHTRRRLLLSMSSAALALTACGRSVAPLPTIPLPSPTPAPPLSLPRDAGAHDSLTEWWYFTGHLQTADQREYGFEFTIFQATRQGAPTGYLAHFALSDIAGQQFSHQARLSQLPTGTPPTSDSGALNLDVNGWTLVSAETGDRIAAQMEPGPGVNAPYRLQLDVHDQKPPAAHNGGYLEYGGAGGSYYYSRTRLQVSGTLDSGTGQPQPVTGQAWMDHQWGNFVVSAAGGWDWYSLQLDDQTELMLYVLRAPDGVTTRVYGSRVLADGRVDDLGSGEITSQPLGSWTSPHTGATYPSGWRLSLPEGEQLIIQPRLADQELYFPGVSAQQGGVGLMAYWEGAVQVTGSQTGVGYVELTGYTGPAQ